MRYLCCALHTRLIMKVLPILLLLVACAANAIPQSGRRVTTPRTAPIAPIQPPTNPEPEAPPPKTAASALMFLPESVLERRLKTLDNKHFRLGDFHGKVLVINLWASWCGPCRSEVPEYERVRKDYLGREVEFIGLTPEEPSELERVNKFVRQTNFGFLIGWADDETARILMNGRQSIPQTLVIDSRGAVVSHWSGYARGRSATRLRDAIDNALK